MEEIIKLGRTDTMTSLEIAEITGKKHAHVMRDIRSLIEQGVNGSNFGLVNYKDKKGEVRPMFELTPKGCLILASGYDALLREKIINKLEELEKKNHLEQYQVPQSFSEALMLAAKQQEKIEQQQLALESKNKEIVQLSATITEMQPKVSYVDTILSSKETVTTTQIAQDYGQSAKAFNILLRNFGVQRKVGGQWILYAKYLPCGYVQSETVSITHRDGSAGSVMHTKWTQKGRLFLYDELKNRGIIPTIEQESVKR
nr:MAG TPA: KilAC domain protein [Caudoviricetes sp.]